MRDVRTWSLLALFALAACDGPAPTAPSESVAPQRDLVAAGFKVTALVVGAAEGSASQMHGPLVVWIGDRVPPNPCNLGASELPAIQFCGVLRNPGGETLQSGELTVGDPSSPDGATMVPFRFATPPSPCATLVVRGVFSNPGPPDAQQNPGPPTVFVTFATDVGGLVGTNPGPPDVQNNPGPPDVQQNPGPPTVGACTVSALAPAVDR